MTSPGKKRVKEKTAAPASPLAPGLPALLRNLFDAVARTASRMTYQIAYVTALAFLSDKRGKNRRADVFARKCEENAQKNAPMGVSVILNALFLWFVGTAIPRRSGNSGDSDMEVSLDVGSFLSDEPAGSPPSGGNSPNDELAKVANLTEINPPAFMALPPEVIPAITANTPATFAVLQTNALTNPKTIGSEILIPDTEATRGQGEGTSSPSKSGEGNGTGTGAGGEGAAEGTGNGGSNDSQPGVFIGGRFFSGKKIGIIRDMSAYNGSFYDKADNNIEARSKAKIILRKMDHCIMGFKKHFDTAASNPTYKYTIQQFQILADANVSSIYFICDLQDQQDPEVIQLIRNILIPKGIQLHISTQDKHAIPELLQLIRDTGGTYKHMGIIKTDETVQEEIKKETEKLEANKTDFTKKMEERRKEFQEKVRKQREELEAKRKAQSQTP